MHSSHDSRTGLGAQVWLALVVVYIVWGSTYLAIRVVVTEGLPPLLSMGVRFLLAGPLLALVLATRGGWRRLAVTRRELAGSALVGVLLLLGGNGMVAVSEQHVPSGLAALLVATTPLWLVGFRALTGDRPGLATWLGTAVGFAGVAVLARPGGHGDAIPLASTLLVVLATFLWATGSFTSGRLTMPKDPFVSAVWQMTCAGVALILSGLATGEAPRMSEALVGGVPTQGALALTYLIVFGSLAGYTAYYWLLRNAPISMVATYAYVNPIVAVLLGWALLSEPITSTVLIGGGLAVLGVLLVVSTERHGHRHEEPVGAEGEPEAAAASAPSASSVPSSRAPVDGSAARPAEVPGTGR